MYKQTVDVSFSNLSFSIGAVVATLVFLAVLSHFPIRAEYSDVIELSAVGVSAIAVAIHFVCRKTKYVFCIVDTHFIIRKEEGERHTVMLDCKLEDIRALSPAGELSQEYAELPVSAHYTAAFSHNKNYCLVYAKHHSTIVHKILFTPNSQILDGFKKAIPLVCQIQNPKQK